MSPFELLGLAADADERAIKRAYAQRLRVTRPDEDPQGFQQLHAAYQAALEYCRGMAADESTAPHEPALEQAAPRPSVSTATFNTATFNPDIAAAVEPPTPPCFDFDSFCIAAFERASAGDAAALQKWLASLQDLWSLQLKARVGQYLVDVLYEQAPPMPADCMETLLRFFDLDHALAGHDPMALQQLKRRSRLAWQLEPTDKAVLLSRLAIRRSSPQCRAHWIVRLLKRPFSWPRALFVGMNSANAGLITDFVQRVAGNYPEDLPAFIDRGQLNFWLAATEQQSISRQRIVLGAARSGAMLVLAVLLAPWVSHVFTGNITLRSMLSVVGLLMIPSALWALWLVWLQLSHWHTRAEPSPPRPSLRNCLIPAMCISGIVLSACGLDRIGLALSVPALWLAARRYWYQHGNPHAFFRSGYVRLVLLLTIPVLHAVLGSELGSDFSSLNAIIAAVAMMAWAADLRKQRLRQIGGS
jgi:hypothetical protein